MPVISSPKPVALAKALSLLAKRQVLVGIPAENDADHPDRPGSIGNAALGYIHENGAPEVNIPARPFLRPGIEAAQPDILKRLEGAARAAMRGDSVGVEQQLAGAGQDAVNSVRQVIQAGIPPPLADATVAGRRRRSKGSSYRRKAVAASDTTPLIDTGDLIRSITYVVRDVR